MLLYRTCKHNDGLGWRVFWRVKLWSQTGFIIAKKRILNPIRSRSEVQNVNTKKLASANLLEGGLWVVFNLVTIFRTFALIASKQNGITIAQNCKPLKIALKRKRKRPYFMLSVYLQVISTLEPVSGRYRWVMSNHRTFLLQGQAR